MTGFAYIRVSGASQVDKDGPIRQRDAIKSFCGQHKIELIDEFFEAGVSGAKDSMDRPAFRDLINMAARCRERGIPVEAIIVERIDRMARDLMISEIMLKNCRDNKLQVFASDHGTLTDMASDGDDPTRKLIRQIFSALSEWEKNVIVKKLQAARRRLQFEGRPFGHAVRYGGKPGEQAVIRDMHELYIIRGYSLSRTAEELNKLGHQTRFGRPWRVGTVLNVLEKTTEVREPETVQEEIDQIREHKIHTRGHPLFLIPLNPHTLRVPKQIPRSGKTESEMVEISG